MHPAFITASGGERVGLLKNYTAKFGDVSPLCTPLDDRIELFTYCSRGGEFMLSKACKAAGWKLTVTSRNYSPWNWFGKVGPLIHVLRKSKARYVFCLDGFDTLPLRAPTWEECTALGDTVRFVKANNWPDVPWLPRAKHYPGAGAYYGCRQTILKFLLLSTRMLKARNPLVLYRGQFDDQLAWKWHHWANPELFSIDTEIKVLHNFAFRRDILERVQI